MERFFSQYSFILVPLVTIAAGFLAGWVLDKIILTRLKKVAEKTKWGGYKILISGLKGRMVFWITLAGLALALGEIELPEYWSELLPKIIIVSFLFSLTLVIAKTAVGLVNLYTGSTKSHLPSSSIINNIIKLVIIILGLLTILRFLGISITPILTALGVGGLAVALALQETLSNLFAGIQIIAAQQIRPGDYIKLESGESGYVVDVSWRNTTVKMLPNNLVIIPNAKLSNSIITNYNMPEQEMSVLMQVGVSYGSDLEKVESVAIEVAKQVLKEVPGGINDFEPFVRFHTFDSSSINFTVILRCREFVDQYPIKSEFVKRLHKRFKEEGIEIPFPIRTVIMKGQQNK